LKISVDYQSTEGKRTGIGVTARESIDAMAKALPDWKWLFYKTGSTSDLNTWRRILWESFSIPKRLFKDRPNLIYSPGFAPALWSWVPQVVMVHDLIGMIYPQHLRAPARFYWSVWLPLCVRRAKKVMAISQCTKHDLMRLLHMPEERIHVVPWAANDHYGPAEPNTRDRLVLKKFGLEHSYFISVGTLESRKNIRRLIRAFHYYQHQHKGLAQLALVGKGGDQEQVIRQLVIDLNLEHQVKLLGYVKDEELNQLYGAALGYVCVSLYEGFGLPVLEAMNAIINREEYHAKSTLYLLP